MYIIESIRKDLQHGRILLNVKYCYRRLHTEESISSFLKNAWFNVEYTRVYDEFLSPDFNRENMNDKPSELIEALAVKKMVRKL